LVVWSIAVVASLAGCASVGPGYLVRDRFDYLGAVSDSWKRQMLLNLVKARYADAPVFLDVASIISQYSVNGTVGAQSNVTWPPVFYGEQVNGAVVWYDRPTITYARNLLSPIPPAAIMSMVQSGWPIDFVLRLTVDSVNGVRNRSSGQMNERPADPQFEELLAAMRRIQRSDAVGIRVEHKDKQDLATVYFGRGQVAATSPDSVLVRRLLKLSPDAHEFQLAFGLFPKNETELALLSRSMMQIFVELAACIDVPEEHVGQGRVSASSQAPQGPCMIRVCSGPHKPAASFVAVPYEGYWFWIDNGDLESKRMLSLLMLFFSLMETGPGAAAPVITVPTG
jgi:hypothetical protein